MRPPAVVAGARPARTRPPVAEGSRAPAPVRHSPARSCARGPLQGVRLRDLAPALLGHADPDRLLRRAAARCRCRASSCRWCCRWTSARPAPATRSPSSRSSSTSTCPSCGGPARRETDTLDCHFDALWLWVPASVPPESREETLEEILALPDLRHWLPSERLVAGSDSGNFVFDQRIVTKALRDLGPLAFLEDGEPFAGCLFHEMVISDGRKMSKHLGNVVDPDELVERYGADTVRLAVLYAARPQRSLNWSDSAVLRCSPVPDAGVGLLAREARRARGVAAASHSRGAMAGAVADTSEHLRLRLAKWCEAAVERTTEDMEQLEMHSAVRNVMRLFDRDQGLRETSARARRPARPGQPRGAAGGADAARPAARSARAAHRRGAVGRPRQATSRPHRRRGQAYRFRYPHEHSDRPEPPQGSRQRTRSCATGLVCHRCEHRYPLEETCLRLP